MLALCCLLNAFGSCSVSSSSTLLQVLPATTCNIASLPHSHHWLTLRSDHTDLGFTLEVLHSLRQGGDALERAHAVTTVIFDKTGTLTQGRMVVAGVAPFQTALTADQV